MDKQEFESRQKETLSHVPEEVHDALSSLAWEAGHAHGYNEVILILEEFVEALEKPLKALVKKGSR